MSAYAMSRFAFWLLGVAWGSYLIFIRWASEAVPSPQIAFLNPRGVAVLIHPNTGRPNSDHLKHAL